MNIGQVLETHLGWAAKMLGIKVATPVFDGVQESDIVELMEKANERFAEENGKNYHWGSRIFTFSSCSMLRICLAESSSSKITIPTSRSASSSARI